MTRRMLPVRRSGLGLLLLAVGRKSGFACFGTDHDAYLSSLAPLVAFTLVSGGLLALKTPRGAATLFLLSMCQLLAPPVIAHPLCRRWDRLDRWALYANILNWAPYLFFIVLALVMLVARVAVQSGMPADPAAGLALLFLLSYMMWFQWFVARGALAISRSRTALLLGATLLFGVILVSIQAIFGSGPQELQMDLK
jgi:hypothetical protein